MNVLFLLVPLAILLAGLGVWAFAWAVRRGQFDDVHTPAMRMLVDDEEDSGGMKTEDGGWRVEDGKSASSNSDHGPRTTDDGS